MTNYSTKLKPYGDVGVEYPDGHKQEGQVPPVDAYHNFLFYNLVADTEHLVSLTNGRLDSGSGTAEPGVATPGELFYDETTALLAAYDPNISGFRYLARKANLDNHTNNTANPHGVTATQAGAVPSTGGTFTGDVSHTGTVNVNGASGTAATKELAVSGTASLQVPDDTVAAGTAGYAAALNYYTESGERLASATADTAHNHWGIYTKKDAVGSGDTQPAKRLSIQGGSEVVRVDWMKVNQMKISSEGVLGEESRFILEPTAGNDAYIKYKDGSTSTFALIGTGTDWSIYNYLAAGTGLQLTDTNDVNVPNGSLNVTGGQLQESGSRVATRTWATSTLSAPALVNTSNYQYNTTPTAAENPANVQVSPGINSNNEWVWANSVDEISIDVTGVAAIDVDVRAGNISSTTNTWKIRVEDRTTGTGLVGTWGGNGGMGWRGISQFDVSQLTGTVTFQIDLRNNQSAGDTLEYDQSRIYTNATVQ